MLCALNVLKNLYVNNKSDLGGRESLVNEDEFSYLYISWKALESKIDV